MLGGGLWLRILKGGVYMLLRWYLFKTTLKSQKKAVKDVVQERLSEKLYRKYKAKAEEYIKDSDLPEDTDGNMYIYFEQKFMDRCFRFRPLPWEVVLDKFFTLMMFTFATFALLLVMFINLCGVTELFSAFLSFPLSFMIVGLWLYLDYVCDLKTIAECEVVLDILSMRLNKESCYHFI